MSNAPIVIVNDERITSDPMSRRTYLTIKACQEGANFWAATEAISSTAMSQGWDLDEAKTWQAWDDEDE